jgi:hypothetical protein
MKVSIQNRGNDREGETKLSTAVAVVYWRSVRGGTEQRLMPRRCFSAQLLTSPLLTLVRPRLKICNKSLFTGLYLCFKKSSIFWGKTRHKTFECINLPLAVDSAKFDRAEKTENSNQNDNMLCRVLGLLILVTLSALQ